MTGEDNTPKGFVGVAKRGAQFTSPLCYEETFITMEEILIGFYHWSVEGRIVEEAVTEVFMEGLALHIIPLVHRTKVCLNGVGVGAHGVGVRTVASRKNEERLSYLEEANSRDSILESGGRSS
jgi:hypothetical protein